MAAPIALYFVARTALMDRAPALAASMPPVTYSVQIRQTAAAASNPKYKVDDATMQLALSSAESAPLDFLPFFLASRAAEGRGDFAGALRLMEEARRRNATRLPIRLYLVPLYLQAGRREAMAREIDYILRINERARIVLLPELVKLALQPQGRPYVAQILAENPPWKNDFFAVARDQRLPPDAALHLLRMASARGGDVTAEERLYISSLFTAGQQGAARERWLKTLPQAERDESRFLSNGDFSRTPTAGDFEWTLSALPVGRADIAKGGAGQSRMTAQYFGGSPGTLAQQQITLAPGRYRLSVAGQADNPAAAGQLFWTIRCHPEGPDLLRVPVSELRQQATTIQKTFSVPGGACRAQTLRLIGEPGDMSVPTDAEFSKVSIDVAR